MRNKRKFLNLHCGNRGIIFTLDTFVAVIVFVLLLGLSSYYIGLSQGLRDVDLQTIRTGSDILALLDHKNILETMNVDLIEINRDNVLPDLYDMKIKVDCKDSSGSSSGSIETSEEILEDKFIGSGKRVFIKDEDNYCIARFFIWTK